MEIKSGIRQGCPLSGTIFALLIDPILRMLHHSMGEGPGRTTIGDYADDLACVVSDYTRDVPKMLRVFALAQQASVLTLKFRKCVLVPLNVFYGHW